MMTPGELISQWISGDAALSEKVNLALTGLTPDQFHAITQAMTRLKTLHAEIDDCVETINKAKGVD